MLGSACVLYLPSIIVPVFQTDKGLSVIQLSFWILRSGKVPWKELLETRQSQKAEVLSRFIL